ncbi:type II toxin-antitoxin system MqsA family antitoxin, partial [Bdellovibrionota bacterium FG-2]
MNTPICVLCRGTMKSGTTDLTLRRGRSVVVIESVPALVCENCGEASLDAKTAQTVHELAEREVARGVA